MFINDYALMKGNILMPSFKWFGDINKFFETVKQTGYPFFYWNGRVYKALDDQIGFEDTGMFIEDISE